MATNQVISGALRELARRRLIVALDTSDPVRLTSLYSALAGHARIVKVGLELQNAMGGPEVVWTLPALPQIYCFYDGKFSDIPNTVAGAISGISLHGRIGQIRVIDVHCMGGMEMLKAARKALDFSWTEYLEGYPGGDKPRLFGVTILTTQKYSDFVAMGFAPRRSGDEHERQAKEHEWLQDLVLNLSEMAYDSGLDGVIVPGPFARAVREKFGPKFDILCAGIRFPGSDQHDQIHVSTPGGAIRNGATFIVMGRDITGASDPAAATDRAVEDIARAMAQQQEEGQ